MIPSNNQDLFVGIVAICLGLVALGGAIRSDVLVGRSQTAQSIQQLGGRPAVAIVYGGLGLFLLGVGISLIL